MKAIAVIGANFGDEGKGRMTDVFARKAKGSKIVVRYNGGAQASHTVVSPEGVRHAFRHHGAGTFAGAPTMLSSFFIVNPFLWAEEAAVLGSSATPLSVNLAAPLTTPYDMLINREMETQRGTCGKRHGTCGLGIGETIERCVQGMGTYFGDIVKGRIRNALTAIRKEWVPLRIAAMPGKPSDWFMDAINLVDPIEKYLDAANRFALTAKVSYESDLSKYDTVIFEGAQGLCLDESHKFFPHVTRSRTGLPNIVQICRNAGITEVEAVYTTRAYLTRHGEGPMPSYDPDLSYSDPTNKSNDYQGAMRFGALDLDLLRDSVRSDLGKAAGFKVNVSLAMTCLDQVPDDVKIVVGGKTKTVPKNTLPKMAADIIGAKQVYATMSPAAK